MHSGKWSKNFGVKKYRRKNFIVAKGSNLPRNPVFLEYYKRKISEGKTKIQALVCVMRRLVNIIYGMMKNKSEYVMPIIPLKEAV